MPDAKATPKPGDYVTGRIHGGAPEDIRQAVFVRDNGDGTVYAKGHLGVDTEHEQDELHCDDQGGYLFTGPEDLSLVPERNLFGEAKTLVAKVRAELGITERT